MRRASENKFYGKLLAGVVATTFLVGAPSLSYADKSDIGLLSGAALGGLLGSQFGKGDGKLVATGLGVFVGGLGGHAVGQSLDRADRSYYATSYRSYGPSYGYGRGHGHGWGHRRSVHTYTYVAPPAPPPRQVIYVQPQPQVYQVVGPAQHCREFTQTVRIGNQLRESYGTACLQPDGSWEMVK